MHRPAPILFLLAYLAFVSLGLPDTVLGVAWPSLRAGFGISQSALGAVLAAGMTGYFVSGIVAGGLMNRLGVGGLLAASSGVVTLALIGYAAAPSWSLFFPVGALMGLGSGAIDAGLNGYAARHFSVRHVNWLHACWGVGASAGPVIMTAVLARGLGYRAGYGVLAAVLGAMAIAFLVTRRSWNEESPAAAPALAPPEIESKTGFGGALRSGRVWLLMATFFVYVGLESTVGQWCFTLLREGRGLAIESAGGWTAAYWASLTAGRVGLGFVIDRMGPDRLLRFASLGVVSGAALFAGSSGGIGRCGLLLLGLGLAPVFPTLMARTPARVGPNIARHAVGFQVSAATLGASLLPGAVGLLVARAGLPAIGGAALGMGVTLFGLHELLLHVTRAPSGGESPSARSSSRAPDPVSFKSGE
jgi:fucose permease